MHGDSIGHVAQGDTGLIATSYDSMMRRALVGTKQCLQVLGQTPRALRPEVSGYVIVICAQDAHIHAGHAHSFSEILL